MMRRAGAQASAARTNSRSRMASVAPRTRRATTVVQPTRAISATMR